MEKQEVRNRARSYWSEFLAGPGKARLEEQWATFISARAPFKKGSCFLAFYPLPTEFNVVTALTQNHLDVALPRVLSPSRMTFFRYLEQGEPVLELENGSFGIMEPPAESQEHLVQAQDVIIVPSLAANVSGYRLGKGGGFYDRLMDDPTFGSLEKWAVLPEKLLDCEFHEQPHDLRLNKIVTEERIAEYL
jgi:5-formyltetrahydrofolate cyclo-ligase